MKLFKTLFTKLLVLWKRLKLTFYTPKKTRFIIKDVPYYSQWESTNLVDEIFDKNLDARKDPKWKNSGASDQLEYLHWSWSICGITCLKMILEKTTHKKYPLITLAKNGLKYGFYSINQNAYKQEDYINSISDLKYKPFVSFINQQFPFSAKIINPLTIKEIIFYLDEHNFVITSVSSKIRDPNSNPIKKGGHLVLILGYDLQKKCFVLHNPSGIFKKSQKYTRISFTDFEKFFGNKGIIVKNI